MVTEVPRAILDNKALPDWGEPQNPEGRKSWTRRLVGMPRQPTRLPQRGGEAVEKQGQRQGSGRTTLLRVK